VERRKGVFFLFNFYLQDVNTYTSVPDSTKLFLVNQFTCRTLAVRGVTVLSRRVMGGTAVKKWHKRKKNIAAEGYDIRGECGTGFCSLAKCMCMEDNWQVMENTEFCNSFKESRARYLQKLI
jgi:hypothetical protein